MKKDLQDCLGGAAGGLMLAGICLLLYLYEFYKPVHKTVEYIHPTLLFIGKWGAIISLGLAIICSVVALVMYISDKKKH